MRIPILLAVFLLAACDSGETPAERAQSAETADNGIECALAGAELFERHCTLERGGKGLLTIHHPDGGFRRLQLGDDGLGAADGSDQGQLQPMPDGRREWTIDRDRYRLPAS
jgi:hypothetical protein